jgi:hypothetical protein
LLMFYRNFHSLTKKKILLNKYLLKLIRSLRVDEILS